MRNRCGTWRTRPHTAHTSYDVPLHLVGAIPGMRLREGGGWPHRTHLLELLGVERPAAMTGKSLIEQG